MEKPPPIVQLANALLLSALNKRASLIRIHLDEQGTSVVELVIDAQVVPEMQPPAQLHGHLIRRLGVMAAVPLYGKDGYACGRIQLQIGERTQMAYFDVTILGQGPTLRAHVAAHGFHDHPPPFTPPGVERTGLPLR